MESQRAAGLAGPATRLVRGSKMIQITAQMRVLVAIEPVDGRKGIDSEDYRVVAGVFLGYLNTAFPQVRRLSNCAVIHIYLAGSVGCQHDPPFCNTTHQDYLIRLRGLFNDLAVNGHPVQQELIRRSDFPPRSQFLPKPLSVEDNQRLQQELRRSDDLYSNALLVVRLTGICIGECMNLALDCLRQLGPDQWALHVPLGKLHTERLVPVDAEVRRSLARILELRALARPRNWPVPKDYCYPEAAAA